MAFRPTLRAMAVCCALAAVPALAKTSPKDSKVTGFDLGRLPPGKNVTIPRPATTYVALTARVVLTATDMPQTVSLKPVNLKAGSVSKLRVSIYDKDSDRVQYVDLSPGTPFLYNFKELSSITVIPQASGAVSEGMTLQVESDKPLEIAH